MASGVSRAQTTLRENLPLSPLPLFLHLQPGVPPLGVASEALRAP